MSAALICAVRCVLSTMLVGRLDPFQRSTAPAARLAPVTERENPAPPALTVLGEIELRMGCRDLEGNGTTMSHMLRPCVAARSVREGRCSTSESTTTIGKPLPSVVHVAPPSVVTITPASVPIYNVSGIS